jgi:hypothetical protein
MSVETVKYWVCDASDCGIRAPEGADGWFDGIYTHGCPQHASIVAAHKANVDSSTRGRGSWAVTYWYLNCACGWIPPARWASWHSAPLREQHLLHLRTTTATAHTPGDALTGGED